MKEWCGKADIMRYEILHHHGGFFIDADAICLRPLGNELLNNDSFCCYENEILRPGLLANGYLGASEGNTLMDELVKEIAQRNMSSGMAWQVTGPQLLTDIVARLYYQNLHVYPSGLFIPRHYTGYPGLNCKKKPYAAQQWGSTLNAYSPISPTP